MKIRPLHDRVIVRRLKAEGQSAGGIFIPENAKHPQARGVVVFCGPGRILQNGERAPMPCKEGDTIIFGRNSGQDFEFDGERLTTFLSEWCVGLVEPDAPA